MKKDKRCSLAEAAALVQDGMTIMVGGFLGVGTPEALIDALVDRKVRKLTLVANDTSFVDKGVGKLIAAGCVEKVIASHIGTNGETGRQYLAGELSVELVPQGTLAERIRCGGAGLGGVLTPVGLGTVVEEGKKKIISGTREYLLELPLRADVALLQARRADTYGNLIYDQTARNFNPLMALAADVVAVLAEEVTPVGALLPDSVATPGIVVDYVVAGGKDHGC